MEHVSINEQARRDIRQQRIDDDMELMRLAQQAADNTSDDTDSLPIFNIF